MSSYTKRGWFMVMAAVALAASSAAFGQSALPRMLKLPAGEAESTVQPATILSRAHTQRQITLVCGGGGCDGSFATLQAKQRLELQAASCIIEVGPGNSAFALMQYKLPSGSGNFDLPLPMATPSPVGATVLVFQSSSHLFLPAMTALKAAVQFSGPGAIAACQIFGDLVTFK
jgi:hypothetical protein